jgi:hypothetical protein
MKVTSEKHMSDNEVSVHFTKWIVIGLCVMITSVAGSCSYSDYLVAEMTKAGADPMQASCAIHSGGDRAICPILAAKP